MATRAELEQALRAADAAGNADDAKALAQALTAAPPDEPAPTPGINALRSQMLPSFLAKPMNYGDDLLRRFVNGATLGGMDRLVGAVTPDKPDLTSLITGKTQTGYERQKRQTDAAKENLGPVVSTGADIAGMLAPGGLLSKGVAKLGLKGAGLGESALREGLAGSVMGGTQEAMDGGDTGDVLTAASLGGLGGAGGGALSAKAGDLLNRGAKALGIKSNAVADTVVPPMTQPQMKQATGRAYDAVDNMGVRYDPNDYQAMTNRLDAALQAANIRPGAHPRAIDMAQDIRSRTVGPITPRTLDQLRQDISRDVTGSRGEDYMANIMRQHLDDFIEKGATTTGTGTAAQASTALRSARDLSRRTRVLETINDAKYRGENSANGRGDVAAIRALLNNPKKRRGMSADEIAAAERVVRGDTLENLLRSGPQQWITPLGAGIAAGSATANPLIGVGTAGAVGLMQPAARAAAKRYTERNLSELVNTIAGGSTTPSMARGVLGRLAAPSAVELTAEDRKALRKARRGY